MGLPEIKLGLIPGYGGMQRLPLLVGEARALELIMTARTVPATEALSIGLVNRVAEGDIIAAGVSFAREFSGHGVLALGLARSAVTRALTAGRVWINSYAEFNPVMPTGVYKRSGVGRELGAESIDAYRQTKSVYMRL